MSDGNVFSYVKSLVSMSGYVSSLPQCRGIRKESPGIYRTNNVLINGENLSSMKLDDNKGTFSCFSGGKEFGDVITLYRLLNGGESLGMFDACMMLASDMGIDIPDAILGQKVGPRKMDTISFVDRFADLAHDALIEELKDKGALYEYLASRKVSAKIIKEWKLGFIPYESHSRMVDKASEGLPKDAIVASGIVTDKGFVPMAGRLVFPILSKSGKAISLSSRVIPGMECYNEDSKYINTKSTHVYDKGATLYGQHLLDGKEKTVVVCEGNLDVIALNEVLPSGTTALAICGSSLTPKHEPLLANAERVVLMLDGDDAGRAAARKSIWLIDKVHLSIAKLPLGSDPWDMYLDSPASLVSHIENPSPYLSSIIGTAESDMDTSDFEFWVSHSYSELGYKSSRRAFDKALRDHSDLTPESIVRLTEKSSIAKRVIAAETDSAVSLSAPTRRAVSAILWLSENTLSAIFGAVAGMKKTARRRFIATWMPVSTTTDVDAMEAVIMGFKERISPELRAIIEQEYPTDGYVAERDMIVLSQNVSTNGIIALSDEVEKLDSLPSGLLSIYSTVMDVSSGSVLSTPEETLHVSISTAESIFTEMAKD